MNVVKTLFLITIINLIFTIKSNAQDHLSADKLASTVYLEAYGNNMVYSLNYEKVLYIGKAIMTTYRAGIGGVPNRFGIPLGIHFLKGSRGKYLDMAVGLSYVYGSQVISSSTGKERGEGIFLAPTIGYRRQLQKGFFFRANAGLNIKLKEYNKTMGKSGLLPIIGISFGHSFGSKIKG